MNFRKVYLTLTDKIDKLFAKQDFLSIEKVSEDYGPIAQSELEKSIAKKAKKIKKEAIKYNCYPQLQMRIALMQQKYSGPTVIGDIFQIRTEPTISGFVSYLQ